MTTARILVVQPIFLSAYVYIGFAVLFKAAWRVVSFPLRLPLWVMIIAFILTTMLSTTLLWTPADRKKDMMLEKTQPSNYLELAVFAYIQGDEQFAQTLLSEISPFLNSEEKKYASSVFSSRKKMERAFEFWSSLYAKQPTAREVLYALFLIEQNRGNTALSQQYAQALQQIDPNNPEVLRLENWKSNPQAQIPKN